MSLSFLSAVRRFPVFLPSAKLAAAALAATMIAAPVWAQVSGPYVSPNGQETYPDGDTTDPNFNPYTQEQQNWDRNNLDTTGTGTAHVGSLMHYGSGVTGFYDHHAATRPIYLRWTAPMQDADRVQTVEYEILPGRHSGSQPVQIVGSCPSDGYESYRMYRLANVNGTTLDLGQPVMLKKCSRHRLSEGMKSLVIRLKGKVEMLDDGGYVASFGPHDSPFNCGPPTWPTRAHQAAGHPPYAEWCDISVSWEVE
ncbi:MAG: hypothetical protein OXC93_03640 [Rhodospirillaceae bacterium]|nr:hypothetical protein [Rhodospirillaceae bacterium]